MVILVLFLYKEIIANNLPSCQCYRRLKFIIKKIGFSSSLTVVALTCFSPNHFLRSSVSCQHLDYVINFTSCHMWSPFLLLQLLILSDVIYRICYGPLFVACLHKVRKTWYFSWHPSSDGRHFFYFLILESVYMELTTG